MSNGSWITHNGIISPAKSLVLIGLVVLLGMCLAMLVLFIIIHMADAYYHQKIANTAGALCDIFGVIYIAYDIFPFVGHKEIPTHTGIDEETHEYVSFKTKHVLCGLLLLATGFSCQIFSSWTHEIESFIMEPVNAQTH